MKDNSTMQSRSLNDTIVCMKCGKEKSRKEFILNTEKTRNFPVCLVCNRKDRYRDKILAREKYRT